MSAVIKQAGEIGVGGVRPLTEPPMVTAVLLDPREKEVAGLRIERDRLAADLAAARETASRIAHDAGEAAAAAIARARAEALAEGHRRGLADAETDEAGRVVAIGRGLATEALRLGERIEKIDALAPLLARACLDRVFARPDAMAAMVTHALEHRLATLRDAVLLEVRVSGADFADTAAIEAAVRAGGGRACVTIDLDLPSGACRITPRLGRIDLDVPAQWAALARALDDMASV